MCESGALLTLGVKLNIPKLSNNFLKEINLYSDLHYMY